MLWLIYTIYDQYYKPAADPVMDKMHPSGLRLQQLKRKITVFRRVLSEKIQYLKINDKTKNTPGKDAI